MLGAAKALDHRTGTLHSTAACAASSFVFLLINRALCAHVLGNLLHVVIAASQQHVSAGPDQGFS
jgi:hypothetical protein